MRRTAVVVALAGAAAAGPGADPPAAGNKYAVVVGVNRYDHPKLPPLRFAVNDATEVGKALETAGYAVTLLADGAGRPPTKANVDAALGRALGGCKAGDTVVVALAGHGLQFEGGADAYFCPADARPFPDQTNTLVGLGDLYRRLDRSFAGVKVLLVDACRDDPGAGRGSRGVDADAAPRPPKGVAALFSCSAGERAFEHESVRHGVFFHHVLEGLGGKARDADGAVTFDGLATYVRRQVVRDVPRLVGGGAKQSPNLKADVSGESPVLVRAAGPFAGARLEDFWPLAVGNEWTYDGSLVKAPVKRVTGEEEVGGVRGFALTGGGPPEVIAVKPDGLYRLRVGADPVRPPVKIFDWPLRLGNGASWTTGGTIGANTPVKLLNWAHRDTAEVGGKRVEAVRVDFRGARGKAAVHGSTWYVPRVGIVRSTLVVDKGKEREMVLTEHKLK